MFSAEILVDVLIGEAIIKLESINQCSITKNHITNELKEVLTFRPCKDDILA